LKELFLAKNKLKELHCVALKIKYHIKMTLITIKDVFIKFIVEYYYNLK